MRLIEDENLVVQYSVFPKYLFKYSALNENLVSAIKGGYLWFSTLDEFNDDFECTREISNTATTEELLEWMVGGEFGEQILEFAGNIGASRSEKIGALRDAIESQDLREIWDRIVYVSRNTANLSGICCFSKFPNNRIMWSHYADFNQGICQIFEADKLLRNTSYALHEVKYFQNVPAFDYISFMLDEIRNPTLRKSKKRYHEYGSEMFASKTKDWEYEGEARLVSDYRGKIRYPQGSLVGVIFGTKATSNTVGRVVEATKFAGSQIKFYQAVADWEEGRLFPVSSSGRPSFVEFEEAVESFPNLQVRDLAIPDHTKMDIVRETAHLFSTV